MKQKTKLVVLMTSFCLVLATCLLSVFAVKNFNLNMAGEIEFVAPGIEATISQATLTGISKKEGSGQMQEFTLTRSMTQSQIADLAGVKSWSGLKLGFDEEAQGNATISFTITNKSSKAIENIMVNLSSNTTNESPIQATPSADFCIGPKASHTFDIGFNVADLTNSTSLTGFKLTVEMNIIKPDDVLSQEEHLQTTGLNFTPNSSTKTASFTQYTTPTAAASTLAESGLAIDIPAVVKDVNNNLYTVTEIESNAFYNSTQITSITLPSTLTKIGSSAFYKCTNLTGNLVIPVGVKEIGNSAFAYCSKLTGSLVIPNNVTTIGQWAFAYCSGFDGELILSNSIDSIRYSTFPGCNKFTGDLIIPDSVTYIDKYAFQDCTGFNRTLTLSKNLTYIEYVAFDGCSGFTGDLVFHEGLTRIETMAFSRCYGFNGKLVFPNSLETIKDAAFDGCKGFTGDLIFGSGLKKIGNSAFQGCSGFTGDLILGDNVTELGSYVFNNCSGFTGRLYLGKSLITIGNAAFLSSKVTGPLVFPDTLVKIMGSAFSYCKGLTGDLIFPEGLETIGETAFESCSGFKGKLVIPSTIKSLDDSAFRSTSQFSQITVNGTNDFCYSIDNCLIEKSTKKLILGSQSSIIPQNEGITEICEYAFYNCKNLTGELKIPSTVTNIGGYAFSSCSGLTGDLVIPDSVETIGSNVFSYCSGLNGSLTLGSGLKTINSYAFRSCYFTGNLVIPDNVITIGTEAFTYGDFGNATIGNGITTIGNRAFSGCTYLNSITITATTPPTLGGTSCFNNTNNCPIYVPAASVDAYQTATNWTEYASRIQAIVEGEQVDASGVITTQTESKYTGVVYQIDTSTGNASIKANSSVSATEIVVFDQVIYNGRQYAVDTIAASAFANNTTLTKITIPSAITTIEPKAFAGCTNLANIVFENTANWHCSITADSTYGTALSVTNSATNIANLTTNYCDLYIKSGTFTSALTLKIESELPTVDEYNFYIQYTSGMTWAELIAHDTLKYGVNSVNNIVGTIVEGRRGPVYSDANFTNATSIPAPVADVTKIASSSVIDATKTYVFASDMMSGPLGLWART